MALADAATASRERGASAVEYGLLIALIAAVIFVAVAGLGGITVETFADSCDEFRAGVTAAGNTVSASC